MITIPAGAQVWIAAGVIDLRSDFTGLSTVVQMKLEQDPFCGHVFVFRGRRGDLVKILRRMLFGRKSERLDRQIEQLELRLEDLESAQTGSAPPQNDAQLQTLVCVLYVLSPRVREPCSANVLDGRRNYPRKYPRNKRRCRVHSPS